MAITKLGNNPKPHEIKRWIDNNALKPIDSGFDYQHLLSTINPGHGVVDSVQRYVHPGLPTYKDSDNVAAADRYSHIASSNIVETQRYHNKAEAYPVKMSLRTIQHWLKELVEEGLLDHKDNKYSVSDKAKNEIRYFGDMFGKHALYNLSHFPINDARPNKTIMEFVNRFGALIVYAFIEATRPFEDKTISVEDKDKTTRSWVENAVPIKAMFDSFIASCISISEVAKKKFDGSEPLYELDRERVTELTRALKAAHPDLYSKLLEARADFFGKPKEYSRERKWKGKPRGFDYLTEESL